MMPLATVKLLDVCVSIIGLTAIVNLPSRLLSDTRNDARAPTVIPETIPLVGHLIKVLRYGFEYFEQLV